MQEVPEPQVAVDERHPVRGGGGVDATIGWRRPGWGAAPGADGGRGASQWSSWLAGGGARSGGGEVGEPVDIERVQRRSRRGEVQRHGANLLVELARAQ